MIFIALGSNVGDRNAMLLRAQAALKDHGILVKQSSHAMEFSALLPANAPTEWNQPFLNQLVEVNTELDPHTLLTVLQTIEQALGRQDRGYWAPREIDLDIVAYHDQCIKTDRLTIPHPRLHERDFVLRPLAAIAPDWQHPQLKLSAIEMLARLHKPLFMGILNVTPDSFSGDGIMHTAAIVRARALWEEGADIVDIGAESTRPGATPIAEAEEWQRLAPVLEAFTMAELARVSVDTRHASTAFHALAMGVGMINDVSGLADLTMRDVLAQHTCKVVVMHALSVPATANIILPEDTDTLAIILKWKENMRSLGIAPERLIFDPGIGFGKSAQHSWMLIEQAQSLVESGGTWLFGHSRKSFMKIFTDAPAAERDRMTLKFSIDLAAAGVQYLRVHNIALHREWWNRPLPTIG